LVRTTFHCKKKTKTALDLGVVWPGTSAQQAIDLGFSAFKDKGADVTKQELILNTVSLSAEV
jgi:hypothetical protein